MKWIKKIITLKIMLQNPGLFTSDRRKMEILLQMFEQLVDWISIFLASAALFLILCL